MELSIGSPRVTKEKTEIKREKADDDHDDGDHNNHRPFLQLFGEKVVRYSRDGHHETINDSHGSNINRYKVGKLPTNLRLRQSTLPSPEAEDDDDGEAAGGRGGEIMRVVSGYHKGLTHFRQLGGGQQQQRRHSSLLERQILPGMSNSSTENGGRSSIGGGGGDGPEPTAPKQLTMFYAGMVNVFDNIPAEQVQAIILLARESCSSKAKLDMITKIPHNNSSPLPSRPKFPGGCKLQADQLPVARKISLQHFMEKRRLRMTSKSPYFSSFTEHNRNNLKTNGESPRDEEESNSDDSVRSHEDHRKSLLPPFPCRSGHFLSSSTNTKTNNN